MTAAIVFKQLTLEAFFLVIASLKDKSSDADTLGCFFTVFVYRVHIKQRVSFGNTQAFSVSLDLWKTAVTCLLWTKVWRLIQSVILA